MGGSGEQIEDGRWRSEIGSGNGERGAGSQTCQGSGCGLGFGVFAARGVGVELEEEEVEFLDGGVAIGLGELLAEGVEGGGE